MSSSVFLSKFLHLKCGFSTFRAVLGNVNFFFTELVASFVYRARSLSLGHGGSSNGDLPGENQVLKLIGKILKTQLDAGGAS